MRKSEIIVLLIFLLSLAISIYFYPKLPDKIPSHWNIQGEVDGYMSKFEGLFLMPIVLLVMFLLFIIIPKIDPLKSNIEKFRKYFDGFIILLFLFMLSLQIFIIFWSLGTKIRPQILFPIGLGVLFFYIGFLLENAQRNWFIGIRTPWTLSSDSVWDKTHKLGGKLFKIIGIIALIGIIFSKYAFWFVIVPVIITSLYLFIFSYIKYRAENR
ncbi:MAG: DUF1648 domain-containing protein [candidate division WOR-3 bacterium]|nr:DUF1648 domain-containing protein [candidate division WOR-3 bacterium]